MYSFPQTDEQRQANIREDNQVRGYKRFEAECVACQTGNTFDHQHWHYCEDFPCLSHVALNMRFCPRQHTGAQGPLRVEEVTA